MINSDGYSLFLADADIVSKLAHWRLLEILPTVFSCNLSQIATLPTIKHRALRAAGKGSDRLFRDADTAKYAWEHIQHMAELPEPNGEIVSHLQRIPRIDAGEAVLLAVAHSVDTSLLATGDKNAIRSFYIAYTAGQFNTLRGRIVCLEQIMSCCLGLIGIADMQTKLKLALDMDQAMKAIFGSRCDAAYESVVEGFMSYISALNRETGQQLILQN